MPNKKLKASADNLLLSDTISMAIKNALSLKGSNPRELSAKIGWAYESLRKVVNGTAFPSPALLQDICDELDLDYDHLIQAKKTEKAINNGAFADVMDEDKLFSKMRIYWKYLDQKQKDKIFNEVADISNRNVERGDSSTDNPFLKK